jgi:putative membrane protein
VLRDHLAIDRTELANERTLLAYIRTSLALFLTGISGVHLPGLGEGTTFGPGYRVAGWIFISAAAAVATVGYWRFSKIRRRIHNSAGIADVRAAQARASTASAAGTAAAKQETAPTPATEPGSAR